MFAESSPVPMKRVTKYVSASNPRDVQEQSSAVVPRAMTQFGWPEMFQLRFQFLGRKI